MDDAERLNIASAWLRATILAALGDLVRDAPPTSLVKAQGAAKVTFVAGHNYVAEAYIEGSAPVFINNLRPYMWHCYLEKGEIRAESAGSSPDYRYAFKVKPYA